MAASEIEKLERLVKENPKGRLFASLADAYRKDGQYPKALEVLEAGLKNHPDYVSARVVLGRVQMAIGDKVQAREAFSRVVELDPESVIALKALADLAEEQGQGEEALRWSGQLLTVDPGNEEAQKQVDRLGISTQAHQGVRLSGIVPMQMEDIAEIQAPVVEIHPPSEAEIGSGAVPGATEDTVAPFEAVKPSVVKTVKIPAISTPSTGPSFNAAIAPLEQEPEPLPLMPLSEEAQTEQVAGDVVQMAAFEPTSFEGGTDAPTERMAGIDPVGLTEQEVRSIGATAGFEPNSGDIDAADVPRSSLVGLETMSGELVGEEAPAVPAADGELEREVEIKLGAAAANEFQESSAAETLQHRSGANEFQVPSDTDTLDVSAAAGAEPLETGGMDLAYIEPSPELRVSMQVPFIAPAPMVPEDPEPAVAEPEPVVTEAMAELYAAQGHLVEALDVYRQLSARNPDDPRFADRIVELEMFVGGAVPATQAPAMSAPADSLDEMELVPAPGAAPSGRVTVGLWLAEVFAQALPAAGPQAHEAHQAREVAVATTPLPPAPVAAVSDVAPLGAPTRPASGNFSLSNVFGEGNQGAPTAKTGSFDAFFGAPTASSPAAPVVQPASPSTRTPRPSASQTPPPSDDDLSSFQDWLQGLKK